LVIRHEFYLTDEQIEVSDDDSVVEVNEYGDDPDEDEADSEKGEINNITEKIGKPQICPLNYIIFLGQQDE